MIKQFYVHVDFMQSRRESLSHQLQAKVIPFADAVELNEKVVRRFFREFSA